MIVIRPVAFVVGIVALLFIVVSIFDIFLAMFRGRFYTDITMVVLFGVAGVFAAIFGYSYGIKQFKEKNELARWTLIITELALGGLFWFLLSPLEGGEYGPVMKSYGLILAITSLIFIKGKADF